MKNLMIYTSPNECFDTESAIAIKIHIDNSLELGWKKEDIILVTNFPYVYNGVEAIICPYLYCEGDKASNKIPVICWMFDNGLIGEDLYWYHDLDAYQNYAIEEPELALEGVDLGLTNYCYKQHWNGGSFFFRKSAEDIFKKLNNAMDRRRRRKRVDEQSLKYLTDRGKIEKSRYKVLNTTYNVQYRDVHFSWIHSKKPLKVLHFHPLWSLKEDPRLPDTLLNTFMYGKNQMGVPLMSDRLIKLFNKHGIK